MAWAAAGAAGGAQHLALPLAGLNVLLSPLLPVRPLLAPEVQWHPLRFLRAGVPVGARPLTARLSTRPRAACGRWRWAHAACCRAGARD